MAAFSDYLENALLNYVFKATAFSSPSANIHVALCTSDPTDGGTGTTIVEPGDTYARQPVPGAGWTNSTAGSTQNDGDITWAQATAGYGTITHVAICDALTGGNVLYHGALNSSVAVGANETFKFPAGQLIINHD